MRRRLVHRPSSGSSTTTTCAAPRPSCLPLSQRLPSARSKPLLPAVYLVDGDGRLRSTLRRGSLRGTERRSRVMGVDEETVRVDAAAREAPTGHAEGPGDLPGLRPGERRSEAPTRPPQLGARAVVGGRGRRARRGRRFDRVPLPARDLNLVLAPPAPRPLQVLLDGAARRRRRLDVDERAKGAIAARMYQLVASGRPARTFEISSRRCARTSSPSVMEPAGIEPATSGLQSRRSSS